MEAANLNRLKRIAGLRKRVEPDRSLSFLADHFRRQIEKPHRQVAAVTEAWCDAVPQRLQAHCRLQGLTRGVLRVGVDSSAHLYQLDRLLRGGLEKRLVGDCRGANLRRVQLQVAHGAGRSVLDA